MLKERKNSDSKDSVFIIPFISQFGKCKTTKTAKVNGHQTLGLEKALTTTMHETILGSDVIVLYLDCFLVA